MLKIIYINLIPGEAESIFLTGGVKLSHTQVNAAGRDHLPGIHAHSTRALSCSTALTHVQQRDGLHSVL